jgi:histidinol-phosphate phosphatase family protein
MIDPKTYINNLNIDQSWTLFLDRDGVINRKLPGDYVKDTTEFEFNEGALEALRILASRFSVIVIVTNQQGIGKGIMSEEQLTQVHNHMITEIRDEQGRIDKIYHCPDLATNNSPNRKPSTGMGVQAKADFPQIDFAKSLIVGDSVSDMEFGERLNMQRIFISRNESERLKKYEDHYDVGFANLSAFAATLK